MQLILVIIKVIISINYCENAVGSINCSFSIFKTSRRLPSHFATILQYRFINYTSPWCDREANIDPLHLSCFLRRITPNICKTPTPIFAFHIYGNTQTCCLAAYQWNPCVDTYTKIGTIHDESSGWRFPNQKVMRLTKNAYIIGRTRYWVSNFMHF